jgi:hypothetical protein
LFTGKCKNIQAIILTRFLKSRIDFFSFASSTWTEDGNMNITDGWKREKNRERKKEKKEERKEGRESRSEGRRKEKVKKQTRGRKEGRRKRFSDFPTEVISVIKWRQWNELE